MQKARIDQLPPEVVSRLEVYDFNWLIAADLWSESFWDEMLEHWTYYHSRPKSFSKVVDSDESLITFIPSNIWEVIYTRELPRHSNYGRAVWWQIFDVNVDVDYLAVVTHHSRTISYPDMEALEM